MNFCIKDAIIWRSKAYGGMCYNYLKQNQKVRLLSRYDKGTFYVGFQYLLILDMPNKSPHDRLFLLWYTVKYLGTETLEVSAIVVTLF